MYKYSSSSSSKLSTCHTDLQHVFKTAILYRDITIHWGVRDYTEQEKAVEEGNSNTTYPFSRHNINPNAGRYCSWATDASPYPIPENWGDIPKETTDPDKVNSAWLSRSEWYAFGGFIIATAELLRTQGKITHALRWGGDWNKNWKFTDQSFHDLMHFEIVI